MEQGEGAAGVVLSVGDGMKTIAVIRVVQYNKVNTRGFKASHVTVSGGSGDELTEYAVTMKGGISPNSIRGAIDQMLTFIFAKHREESRCNTEK